MSKIVRFALATFSLGELADLVTERAIQPNVHFANNLCFMRENAYPALQLSHLKFVRVIALKLAICSIPNIISVFLAL